MGRRLELVPEYPYLLIWQRWLPRLKLEQMAQHRALLSKAAGGEGIRLCRLMGIDGQPSPYMMS